MEAIKTFLVALYQSPHYSYGWLVLAALSILPAIVSGNLVQHDLSRLMRGEIQHVGLIKSLLLNSAILLICVCIITYASYLYFWV